MDENIHIIEFKIDNTRPIELEELSRTLSSFSNQYKDFIDKSKSNIQSNLYVKEVRKGSFIFDLVSNAPETIPVITEAVQTIIRFGKSLKDTIDYFSGKTEIQPDELSEKECDNVINMLKPLKNDPEAQYNINISDNFNSSIVINIPGIDVPSIVSSALHTKDKIALENEQNIEEMNNEYKNVLLQIYQARNDASSKVGDKGIIEEISKAPLKVVFEDEAIKESMISSNENIFHFGYYVDVTVQTIEGKPKSYKITRFREKFHL